MSKFSTIIALAAGLLLLLAAATDGAHHSIGAEFDAEKPLKQTGLVTKIEWRNPHVLFFIDVTDENGTVTTWGWETSSPNRLMRRGWTRNSMRIGDVVSVEGCAARDGSARANTYTVVLTASGRRLFGGFSQGQGR